MKKIMAALISTFTLASCGNMAPMGGMNTESTGNSIGNMGWGIAKMWVQNQCVGELQKRNEWRAVAFLMSAEKQAEWENKICGCATSEAPKHLSAADMTQLLSEEGRAKVMTEVTVKTVTACFKSLYQPDAKKQ